MSEFPRVPGYELQSELGRGGMAVVYSAVETNLGRQVAIKIVQGGAADPDGQIERLENEARGLAALHHPHIVDLYSFGRLPDGSLYYVMPLLPGGSLEDWPKPASEDRVAALLENLLDALSHAHALDIVHRDIKPANILFDRHDRPLLADFGAALMRKRSTRLTSHGGAIGSSGYMSPEQARGFDVDARSDLYSTAVLAFELLTGKRPFEGPDDLSIAIAQTEQPVPRLPPGLQHWQAFFDRALAVNPQQRFTDATAMRLAMRALRQPPPVSAKPRPRLAIALVAGVLLLGVLALAIGWWRRSAEPVRAESVAALVAAGRLTPPDEPNALAELVRARGQEVDRAPLDALQGQLLDTLAGDFDTAFAAGDGAAAAAALRRWRDAVDELEVGTDAKVIARLAAIEATLREQLAGALASYDRESARAATAVVAAWDTAPEALRALAKDVQAIPAVGERFTPAGEPELVLVSVPDGARPGLAVMAAPVDPALFGSYLQARGRPAPDCPDAPAPAQGCLDLAAANDLAQWLSDKTQHAYRVPTRDELAAAIAHVATVPAQAWTSTCHQVRVARQRDAPSRAWSGVRKLFGRTTPQKFDTRCEGNYALALDGGAGAASVHVRAAPATTAVLVREMTVPQAPDAR